jgi:hypothetical protein
MLQFFSTRQVSAAYIRVCHTNTKANAAALRDLLKSTSFQLDFGGCQKIAIFRYALGRFIQSTVTMHFINQFFSHSFLEKKLLNSSHRRSKNIIILIFFSGLMFIREIRQKPIHEIDPPCAKTYVKPIFSSARFAQESVVVLSTISTIFFCGDQRAVF